MQTKFHVLRERMPPPVIDVPEHLFVSKNDKTGWSINTAITQTCNPSRLCRQYCYGLGGRIVMDAALRRQSENVAFFENRKDWEIRNEAEDVVHTISRSQNFMRMFGVGDLQPGSVTFISWMAQYARIKRPGFRIWVATRKLDLAAGLITSPNLHVMMSFDASTPEKNVDKGRELLKRGKTWFAAWARTSDDDIIPPWVSVVFEEHKHGGNRANRTPERRACMATAREEYGGNAHSGACAQCTFCFDTKNRRGVPKDAHA